MMNPPCCVSLQRGTKIIAIVHTVMLTLCLLVLTVSFVVLALNFKHIAPYPDPLQSSLTKLGTEDGNAEFQEWVQNVTVKINGTLYYNADFVATLSINQAMSIIIVTLVYCAMGLALAVQLWRGAVERNLWRVKVWFHVYLVAFIVGLILLPFVLLLMFPTFHIGMWVASVVQYVILAYTLWVVYAFVQEMEAELAAGNGGRMRLDLENDFVANAKY